MHQRGAFNQGEQDGVQVLELPYEGKALSMVILLPSRPAGLRELEKKLSPESLERLLGALAPRKLDVEIPRFTVTRAAELSGVLGSMGMPSAFDASADFSGMDGKTDLFLTAVVHEAFVDVNEEGTEAATATAAIGAKKNGHSKPHEFKAYRPFLFVIRDHGSGAILFLGRVTDPRSH